jgi:hypothetical protein
MLLFKKMLVLILVLAAMYLAYFVVNFLKTKIKIRENMGAFLLLLVLSFASVFLIITSLGFLLIEYKTFFFNH